MRSLVATAWGTIRSPRRTMRSVRIERGSSRRLLTMYLGLASLCLLAALAKLLGLNSVTAVAAFIVYAGFFLAVFMGTLRLLTWIEERGVRLFGQRRGWRVTPDVALSVCAHASVGWLFGAAAALGVIVITFSSTWAPQATMAGRLLELTHRTTWVPATLLCLFAGMLMFEILVYVGIRESRFANVVKAPKPRERQRTAGTPVID